MFGLFKKSSEGIDVIDKVWLSKQAKLKACVQMKQLSPHILLVAWFEETLGELRNQDGLSENTISAKDLTFDKAQNRMVVFAEHYPLASVEQTLFSVLRLSEVPVMSSLEDHLFFRFGGAETINAMKNLGVGEDEIIGHTMVTRSIRRAQEKIAKETHTDYAAPSCQEWFKLNMVK
jgi:hypothetical protein